MFGFSFNPKNMIPELSNFASPPAKPGDYLFIYAPKNDEYRYHAGLPQGIFVETNQHSINFNGQPDFNYRDVFSGLWLLCIVNSVCKC
jgi:hypothetical protein